MAAVLVFVVFLVAIAISLPIGVSMILGSVAPIFLLDRGGNLAQLLHNTFSGANNTPILAVPLFILGGIYSGKFTPTEAACISVFYAILVSLFIYKSIKPKDLIPFLCSSVKTYGGLAFVLAFATAFGRVLSMTKATQAVESFITTNFHSAALLLTVLVVVFLLLGMVMDTGPAIIILAPVLLPAVKQLGIDGVHFGVVLVCCLSIGLATPPFGLDLFVAGNLSEEPPWRWPSGQSPLSCPSSSPWR